MARQFHVPGPDTTRCFSVPMPMIPPGKYSRSLCVMDLIKSDILDKWENPPMIQDSLHLKLVITHRLPRSLSKAEKAKLAAGKLRKLEMDKLQYIMDVLIFHMEGIVFLSRDQIACISVKNKYGDVPFVTIEFERAEPLA